MRSPASRVGAVEHRRRMFRAAGEHRDRVNRLRRAAGAGWQRRLLYRLARRDCLDRDRLYHQGPVGRGEAEASPVCRGEVGDDFRLVAQRHDQRRLGAGIPQMQVALCCDVRRIRALSGERLGRFVRRAGRRVRASPPSRRGSSGISTACSRMTVWSARPMPYADSTPANGWMNTVSIPSASATRQACCPPAPPKHCNAKRVASWPFCTETCLIAFAMLATAICRIPFRHLMRVALLAGRSLDLFRQRRKLSPPRHRHRAVHRRRARRSPENAAAGSCQRRHWRRSPSAGRHGDSTPARDRRRRSPGRRENARRRNAGSTHRLPPPC